MHRLIRSPLAVSLLAACAAHAQLAQGPLRPLAAPPGLAASDCLGSSVATGNGELLAGARGREGVGARAGAIARWEPELRTWAFESWITSPRPAAGQEFGHSLALRGSVMVSGAPADDLRGTDAGAAWVFTPGTVIPWMQRAELVPPSPEAGERFGWTVATSGSRVACSAPLATVQGKLHAGRVCVYEPSGTGFAAPVVLTSPAPAEDANFGESLVCDGSWLFVGSPGDDVRGTNAGAVFAFRKSPLGWTLVQRLESSIAGVGGRFGRSIAFAGTQLWISEPRASGGGAVHLLEYDGSAFQQRVVNRVAISTSDDAGWSIALAGGYLISGTPRASVGGTTPGACGVARVASGAPNTVQTIGRVWPALPGMADLAGTSVAAFGTRALIGIPGSSAGTQFGGAVLWMDLAGDCDADSMPDWLEVAGGEPDQDGDGVPNACDCLGDIDDSRVVDFSDIALAMLAFGPVAPATPADLDENGTVDFGDVAILLMSFGPCS